jgi:autotransporter-associated beta strand protein
LTIASALTFSGSVKLFKLGQGRLILSGNNSFTGGAGGIVVGEGILQAASSTAFGDATNTVTQIWGTAVEISGGITLVNPMQIGLSGYDSKGWMNQVTGSVRNVSGNNTLTGALTSSGYNRINSDAGTLTLTNDNLGADQTIGGLAPVLGTAAGNVVITSLGSGAGYNLSHDGTGTLTLQLSSSSALTGKTLGSFGGALVLDFTNMSVATNMFLATETLSLRGSQFQVVGKATGNTSQTFATFTVANGISRLSVNSNGGALTTLTLGAFAAPSGYGTVDFLPSLNAVFNATAGGAAVNQNGILGSSATNFGFATAGNDWAAYSSPSIVAFSAYTAALPATGSLATGNYTLVANQTVTATQPANSLKIFPSAPVTLTANTGVQLNTSAFLISGATGNDVTLAGAGTFGSTTLTDYFHLQGANNLIISAALADNSGTTNTGIIFAGTGTGGVQITSTGIINLTANTTYLYFEGGLPGASRQVSNAGSITKASGGNFDIAHTGTDSVVFTNTGVISVTGGNFYVGSYAGAYGKYVQSGASSSFNSTVPVAFSYNSATVNNGGASYGTSAFDLQGGSFSVGPNTFLVFGNAGSFAGTQSGGNLLVVRPNNPAFFLGEEGSGGGTFTYAQSAGTFTVVGNSVLGGRTGAVASYAISGGTASFQQGLILGLQDFAQGTFTQTGGTVTVGTGVNISDGNYLKGNNVIGLSLAFNQTLSNGNPAITKGTYNLLGGTLQANDITTGQGNGYLAGANAAANTFTESSLSFTTTSGGTALFNWGAGTLQPFDNELTIGAGVQVALTAAGATLNTNDKDGVGRTVTFNTPITGGYGLTATGNGLLMLNSAVSYAGDTTVSTGTLRQGVANVLASGAGAGNLVLNSGATKAGTFDLNGANAALNGLSGDSTSAVVGQVVNNAAGAVTLTIGNNNATSTFNGVIKDNNNAGTGTLALTKTGSGTLTLGGANTYTGATTVSAGKLTVNGSLAAGSTVAIAAGATLSGYGAVNGAVTASSGAILTAGAAGSANMNLAGGLTLAGIATLNTSALALGQGTGAATFTVGVLTASGAAGSVTLNVTSGSNYTNGATYSLLTYTGGSIGGTGTSAFTQGTIFGLTGRQSASIDFSSVGQINLVIGGVSPVWSGYDSTGLVRSTAWTEQTLNAWTTTNWYTGSAGSPTATGVSASDAVLFDDTALTVGITLGGTNPIGAIVVDITGADVTPSSVTFNNSVANYVLQGSNGITGSTSLIKSGTGTLAINNANSFTGGVNLNAGEIIVGNVAALGAVTNTVAFGAASNAFLSLNNNSVTLGGLTGDATATVRNGGSSANAVLTLGGAATSIFAGALVDGAGSSLLGVTTAGTTTLVLTGVNTYTGGTTIGAGSTLQIGNNGTTGSIVGAVTANGVLTFNRTNSVTYPGTVTGTGSVVAASGTLVLTGSLNNSGTNSITAGATLQVGNATTNGSLGNVTDAGTLAFANNGTAQTYAGTVTGGGAVNFTAGTLILTGALNNTGADTIAAGATLQIGNGSTSGTFASDVTVTGTLAFNPNGTTTYGNLASGAGNLSVLGGTVILSSGSSYTGATSIVSGATLQIGSGGTTGSISSSSAVTNNGTLIINRSGTAVFNNAISGAGALTINGAATLTLGGNSSFSGTTSIQRGTVKLASSTALGSTTASVVIGSAGQIGTLDLFGQSVSIGAVSAAGTVANQIITNSSTLTDSVLGLNTAAGDMTYAGKFTNSTKKLGLTVTGGNALVLTGLASANTMTGTTAVQNGTLKFGNASTGLSASQVVLGGNGTNGRVDLAGWSGSLGGLAAVDASAVAANQLVGNSGAVAATLTVAVPAATTATFNGVIQDVLGAGSSTTGLTVANNATGVQALTGANTYTGATTITTGTVQIGAAGTAGSLGATAVTIGASGTLLYSRTDSTNFGSVTNLTGAGAITVGTGYTLNTGTTDGIFNTTGALNLGVGTAATTVSSFAVNANATIGSLNAATNTASANTVTIATGKTLTTNAGLSLGYDAGAGTVPTKSNITVTGAGTFNVTGTTVNISKDLALLNSAWVSSAILDVTGLAAFTANVTTFNVGVGSTSSGQGTLLLSNTANTLLATTIDIADTGGNNGPGTTSSIVLGTGTNVIQVDTLQIGRGKSSGIGLFGFASQTSGSAGTLTLTNKAGSGGASISVGDAAGVSTAGNAVGTLDLRGHVVNVTAATLNIGKNDDPSNTGSTSGTVNFDTGTFTANALIIAAKTVAGTGAAIGVLNVSGGAFTVTSGGTFTLGSQATAGTSQATLNLTGGTLTSNAAILNGGGSTTATLNLNGGTLDLVGNTIGNSTASVTLTLAAGTLKNVAQINNGAAVTKTTAGTLTLAGASSYTGVTTVSAGKLAVTSFGDGLTASALGLSGLAPANLVLATGTTLGYVGAGETSARGFTVSTASTLDASGTGALAISSSAKVAFSNSTTTRSLTLDGTSTGANSFGADLSVGGTLDADKINLLVKNGVGTWIIANGATLKSTAEIDVNVGVLGLSSGVLSATGRVVLANGSTLRFESGNADDLSGRVHFANGASATLNLVSDVTFASGLTVDGATPATIVKSGAGKLTLAAANTSVAVTVAQGTVNVTNIAGLGTGATTVNGGLLAVNASVANTVTVNTGGTVGGGGSIATLTIASGAKLSPGNSPGTLTAGNATLFGGSIFEWQVQDAADVAKYDHFDVTGTLDLSNASSANRIVFKVVSLLGAGDGLTTGRPLNFDAAFSAAPAAQRIKTFNLGTFASVNLGANANINDVFQFDVSQFTYTDGSASGAGLWSIAWDSGNHLVTVTAVPEPSTYGFGLGALALAAVAIRRRRKTQPKA